MFWDNNNDSEWTQRWKNMVFFNVPVTNQTRNEAMGGLGILIVICLVLGGLAWAINWVGEYFGLFSWW